MEFKYSTVEEYFKAEYPHLVISLNKTGAFWPKVKSNQVSKADLENEIETEGYVKDARMAMLKGRKDGLIADPEA